MPVAELAGEPISYEVRNSSRARYPRIDVDLTGVTVVIPDHLDVDVESFLEEKADWVVEKECAMEPYRQELPERRFEDGARITFQGKDHTIRVVAVGEHEVRNRNILLSAAAVNNSSIQAELESLYRQEARAKIQDVIDIYAPKISGTPNTIYIKNQKTRWGSCSSKNNLNFNWRLIMAPPQILEYVVVHELVHLEYRDHSNKFWSRLKQLCPHALDSRDWLQANDHRLIFTEDDLS